MSILDRFLLFLLALVGLCTGVLVGLFGTSVFGAWSLSPIGDLSAYPLNAAVIIIGLIIILLSLRFLFFRVRRARPDYVLMSGDHGNIRISFETIRQLANRSGGSIRGVQEFDTRLRATEQGVTVFTRVRVLPDIDIQAMSRDVQGTVKEYVEKTTGVHIDEVVVNIVELATAGAKSSKAWVD